MPVSLIVDFENERDRRRLSLALTAVRAKRKQRAKGRHRVDITEHRPKRSGNQNAWYWGVIMPMAAAALTESQGETFDPDRAHLFFKGIYLAQPVVDRRTGEVLSTIVRSSAVLDTAEFTEYVEKVRQWMAEYLGVIVPDPVSQLSA